MSTRSLRRKRRELVVFKMQSVHQIHMNHRIRGREIVTIITSKLIHTFTFVIQIPNINSVILVQILLQTLLKTVDWGWHIRRIKSKCVDSRLHQILATGDR